jgi:hypothetical protein
VRDLGVPLFPVIFDEQLPAFREQVLHACVQAVELRLGRIRLIWSG